MQFDSISEVIDFAIEKEIEAAAFYADAAQQELYSGARQLFTEFAQEERKHQQMLENLKNNITTSDTYKFSWVPDLRRSDYLVDMVYEPGMPYTDILRMAMKREEKSLKLYRLVAEKAETETQLNIFKVLCQEEAKHKLALETLYDDFMAAQGD
jgi:rubrerythrin